MHDDYPQDDDLFQHFEAQFDPQEGLSPAYTHRGVEVPAGYLPEGINFSESEHLWDSTAEYKPAGQPDDTPERITDRMAAEEALATSIDAMYGANDGKVEAGEDGRQRLKMFLDQSDSIATLSMERFTASDGTLVDTMSYKNGKSWDSTQILVRAPGMPPRIMGAVTDKKTGEVVARPPGGYYGTNSSKASDARQWEKNFQTALPEKPRFAKWMIKKLGGKAMGKW